MRFLISAARRAQLPGADALAIAPGTPTTEAWSAVARETHTAMDALVGHVATALKLTVADLSNVEPKAIKLLPEKLARRYQVLPLRETDRNIIIATADPGDLAVEQAVGFAAGRAVVFEVASPSAIAEAIDAAYASAQGVTSVLDRVMGAMDAELADAVKIVESMEPEAIAEQEADSAPVIKLTSLVLRDGIMQGASDVHIEPGQRGVGIVRFRVDGVMRQYLQVPMSALNRIVSRIKVLAKLDIADRMRPQDGRARVQVDNKHYDLRVSTVPTRESEKAVIRVLRSDTAKDLDDMGLPQRELARIRQLLGYHEGIVCVTGPTGSGKTTTLYAALRGIATRELNVITVEDPVEYELPGITQIQVETKRGVTFASALRAVLRQDPDVIFVGEIRDNETAQIAVQAAMTGHLVLATLHTNDAASSVSRLADLGIDRPSIAATLRGAIAQRLVRRLCPTCAIPVTDELTDVEKALRARSGVQPIMRAIGCPQCGGTGYRGRVPVLEVFVSSSSLADSIARGATALDLQRAAVSAGMRVLRETALDKVADGITTLQEVERVTGVTDGEHAEITDPARFAAVVEAPASSAHGAPAAASAAKGTPVATARVAPANAPGVSGRVLVVDDDPVARRLARALLEQCGMTVTEAQDGIEGRALIDGATDPYALIVTDLHMPRLDGEGLLGHVRTGAGGPSVIVLTGTDDGEAEARLMEMGADDYVRKPLDAPRFVARVKAALRRRAL